MTRYAKTILALLVIVFSVFFFFSVVIQKSAARNSESEATSKSCFSGNVTAARNTESEATNESFFSSDATVSQTSEGQSTKGLCFCGDVTDDGRISSEDARLILRFFVKLDKPTELQLLRADTSFDGKLAPEDARLALRMAVKSEPVLPHELIWHDAKEPTCMTVGWNAYQTCLHCDYTTYSERPAEGHMWENTQAITALSVCAICGTVTDRIGTEIYGIGWKADGVAAEDVRICDAAGLRNNYMIGPSFASEEKNAFDSIFPWAGMRRCCLNGEQIIYDGEKGFSLDGTAGDVFVEIPVFWSCHETVNGQERIAISPKEQPGFQLEPAFFDANGEPLSSIYVAAYATGETNVSASGLHPTVSTLFQTFLSAAERKGFGVYDVAVWAALQKLSVIEFGTRDISPYLNGIGELPYNTNCKANADGYGNEITVASTGTITETRLRNLQVGMTVLIENDPVKNASSAVKRQITAICENADNSLTFTFDGPATAITAEKTCIAGIGQPSGQTDAIPYHTGRWKNNVGSSFKYRGLENLWGNVWMQTAGLAVKNLTYYVTTDPTKYSGDLSEWSALSFAAPEQNKYPYHADAGWILSFGNDARYSWLLLPDEVGADAARIGDKLYTVFQTDADGNSVAQGTEFMCVTGGGWDHGLRNGPFTVRFWSSRTKEGGALSWLYGSRLVKR